MIFFRPELQRDWVRQAKLVMYLLLAYSCIVSIAFLILAYVYIARPPTRQDMPVASKTTDLPASTSAVASVLNPIPDNKPPPTSPLGSQGPAVVQSVKEMPSGEQGVKSAGENVSGIQHAAEWPDRAKISKPENWTAVLKKAEFTTFFLNDVPGKGSSEAKVMMLTNYNAPQSMPGNTDSYLSLAYIIRVNCALSDGGSIRFIRNSERFLSGKDLEDLDTASEQKQKKFDPADQMFRFACASKAPSLQ